MIEAKRLADEACEAFGDYARARNNSRSVSTHKVFQAISALAALAEAAQAPKWISVEERLPALGQAVLVRRKADNWQMRHTLSDGRGEEVWRWQACRFTTGRTAAEVAASGCWSWPDVGFNNEVPYGWQRFGSGDLNGQDVSHWCPIAAPQPEGQQ